MKNMKKVLACVLALTLLLSMFSFSASASAFTDITGEESYAEAVEILAALDLLAGYPDGSFGPEKEITRAEFTAVVCRALGLESAATQGETQFSDVPATHYASGYINVATARKLIVGFGDGTFGPDQNVTYEQAVKLVVAAIGYTPVANLNGGYPTGYLSIAAQKQLLDGVNGQNGQNMTRAGVAQLLYNALDVNIMEQTGVSNGVPTYSESKTKNLLNSCLNVERVVGVVTNNDYANTSIKEADKKVSILGDDVDDSFYIGDTNAADFLGQNVVAFVKKSNSTDKKTVVAITGEAGSNTVVTLTDMDTVIGKAAASNVFEYKAKVSDTKAIKLNLAAGYKTFYNGEEIGSTNDKVATLKPADGTLTFIDNNGDSKYEYVMVEEYRDIVVDSYIKNSGKVTDKAGNRSVVFDPTDLTVQYTITLDGKEIEPSELQEDDVISLYETVSGNRIKAIVSRGNSVAGMVTSKVPVRNNSSAVIGYNYVIDGTTYGTSPSYTKELQPAEEGTFYLNAANKIAYKDARVSTNLNYGFIIDVGLTSGVGAGAQVEMIDKDGNSSVVNFYSEGKYRLPGATSDTPVKGASEATLREALVNKVVTYKLKGEEISRVDVLSAAGKVGQAFEPSKDVYTYNTGYMGKYKLSDNAIVFNADLTKASLSDSDVTVSDSTAFVNNEEYASLIFINSNYEIVAMVNSSTKSLVAEDAPLFLVSSVGLGVDEDGNSIRNITGSYLGSSEVVSFSTRSEFTAEKFTGFADGQYAVSEGSEADALDWVTAGSIISFTKNASDKITAIRIFYTGNSNDGSLQVNGYYDGYRKGIVTDSQKRNAYSYIFGEVYVNDRDALQIGAPGFDGEDPMIGLALNLVPVNSDTNVAGYRYTGAGYADMDLSIGEVEAYNYIDGEPEPGDIVMVRCNANGRAVDVVVIGNNNN